MFARAVWSATLWCAVLVCAFSVVLVPLAALLGIVAAVAVVVAFVSLCFEDVPWVERQFGPRHAVGRASAALAALLVVTGLFAVTVGVLAGPSLALASTGLLLGAALWAQWQIRTAPQRPVRTRRPPLPVRPVPVPPVPPVTAASLSTDELCLAWRRSFLLLQRASDEQGRQAVIAARQAYLDELERRDRRGFTKWLDSGARAAGDPRRFLRPAE
ncbi:hypothetical protein [Amycolatopsis benzoatilytica]|uniref:hypothetical protein n=1 Tax=Amycolatopsis benzoatilytica TaxID=346045 RepID=UPI0003801EA1|nr:hypothetical protein [Amycolatopsis benzoatilytica]